MHHWRMQQSSPKRRGLSASTRPWSSFVFYSNATRKDNKAANPNVSFGAMDSKAKEDMERYKREMAVYKEELPRIVHAPVSHESWNSLSVAPLKLIWWKRVNRYQRVPSNSMYIFPFLHISSFNWCWGLDLVFAFYQYKLVSLESGRSQGWTFVS